MRVALLACALAACASSAPPPRTSAAPPAAVLAASVCPQLRDRLTSLSSDATTVDSYLWVKQCDAHVERGDLFVALDAFAWVALDRDLGVVAVREFVHATVHMEVELAVVTRYVADRLEITVTPRGETRKTVEPVGTLDLEPQNWLGLLAIELAPSAGVSPEAVAKGKLREVAEQALMARLSMPFTFSYDARRGTLRLDDGRLATDARRLRVAPRGTALVGPFPASSGASAHVHLVSGPAVFMRPVCRGHAERLIDADRRGDVADTRDWTSSASTLPAMPCPWMLALRASTLDAISVVSVDVDSHPAPAAVDERDRWVSVDDVTIVEPPEDGVSIVVGNDLARAQLFPPVHNALPLLVKMGPDEHLSLRASRGDKALAVMPVPDDASGALTLPDRLGTVRLRARVQKADE